MNTAEVSVQWTANTPPTLYGVERTDARFDEALWKELEQRTPSSTPDTATPIVEWTFIANDRSVYVQPLATSDGLRICDIPSFHRAVIYPVQFGFPPRLETEYQADAEAFLDELSRREVAEGSPAPQRTDALVHFALINQLWALHRTPEEEDRWLQKLHGIGARLVMGHHFQGGIHERDLDSIRWRADFQSHGSVKPVSVFCAKCEERLTSVAHAQLLPSSATGAQGLPTITLADLAKELGCKMDTMRGYCKDLGIDRKRPLTPADAAQIRDHRRNLKRRHHLKRQSKAKYA